MMSCVVATTVKTFKSLAESQRGKLFTGTPSQFSSFTSGNSTTSRAPDTFQERLRLAFVGSSFHMFSEQTVLITNLSCLEPSVGMRLLVQYARLQWCRDLQGPKDVERAWTEGQVKCVCVLYWVRFSRGGTVSFAAVNNAVRVPLFCQRSVNGASLEMGSTDIYIQSAACFLYVTRRAGRG